MANKIVIPLDHGYKLVAEGCSDPAYGRELYVYLTHESGVIVQDIAIIRNKFEFQEDSTKLSRLNWIDGKYEVFVYGDENSEDYTHEFCINRYEYEEDE